MLEKLKKGVTPILWTIDKLSIVTPLAFYIYDFFSDITLAIEYHQNCRVFEFIFTVFVSLQTFISAWFLSIYLSYTYTYDSEVSG